MRKLPWIALAWMLYACAAQDEGGYSLLLFRNGPAALLRVDPRSRDVLGETRLSLPEACALEGLHPQPRGGALAAELACPGGAQVVSVDPHSGALAPVLEATPDSHFLAWGEQGIYLRVDALGSPRVVYAALHSGETVELDIPVTTYALAPAPDSRTLLFALTAGIGHGSELWLRRGGDQARLLAAPEHILAYPSWSPDGKRIAFLRLPDSDRPDPIGELWVMNADGRGARYLAPADAGNGSRPAWSPDGSLLAYAGWPDPEGRSPGGAQDGPGSLLSIVAVETAAVSALLPAEVAPAASVLWSPDGGRLAFQVVSNGTMSVWIADVAPAGSAPFMVKNSCCPAWVGE